MVEIVTERRMYFAEAQMGVLSYDFISRPPMGKMIHCNLRHAHARMAEQVRGLASTFFNVRISY